MQTNYNNQSGGDNGIRQYQDSHQTSGSHPQSYPFASGSESFASSFQGMSRPSSASHNTKPGHIRTPPSTQYFTSSPNSSGALGGSGYGPAFGQSSKGNSPGYSSAHRGSVGGDAETIFAYGTSGSGVSSPRSVMPFQSNQSVGYSNNSINQGHYLPSYPPPNLRHTPHPLAHSDIPQNIKQSDSPSSDTNTSSQQRHVGITPLRRGQACQSCRRRKLKCDAQRPV